MKVRKRPVEVDAYLLTNATVDFISNWCNAVIKYDELDGKPSLAIYTLEGTMTAQIGDWIIKGVNGEFYPCKDDIFRKTYEFIEDEPLPESKIIEVVSITDNDDGSMSAVFDMSPDMIKIFAKIGLLKVLKDSADKAIEEHGVE